MTAAHIEPIAASDRQESIDVLRGIAVLGILLMNIRFFAMIQAAYFNPTAYGDLTGINYVIFVFNHVFADQKFMTIFSLLFGAGIVLMGTRLEARGASATWLLYRRTFWLLVLGALHAYLLWYGDILVIYALCGFFVILFRRRSPTTQFVIGLLMLIIGSALALMAGLTLENWPAEAYEEALRDWAPGADAVAREVAIYQGPWSGQQPHRIAHSLEFHTIVFLFWAFWRAGGLMLIGMAAYRWGLFTAVLGSRRYRSLAIIGLVVGLPLVVYGLHQHQVRGWDHDWSFFQGAQFNYWGSLFIALAYVCGVMLWFLSGKLQALLDRLAAVGRMAFSNYIVQTLLCTLLFYGHGLGWFGQAERWQQFLVVLGVWLVILTVSPWWLARYRFGPLEWLWRSLTYFERQPFRRSRGNRRRR